MKSDKRKGTHEAVLDQSRSAKQRSLKLERQVIRTLTGDELRMIGGGAQGTCGAASHTNTSIHCG